MVFFLVNFWEANGHLTRILVRVFQKLYILHPLLTVLVRLFPPPALFDLHPLPFYLGHPAWCGTPLLLIRQHVPSLARRRRWGRASNLAYASCRLYEAETRYHSSELECLAIVCSVENFRCHLYGCPITVVSDSSALQWLQYKSDLTSKLARWAMQLQQYEFVVVHPKGSLHIDADFLSMNPADNSEVSSVLDIATVQSNEAIIYETNANAFRSLEEPHKYKSERTADFDNFMMNVAGLNTIGRHQQQTGFLLFHLPYGRLSCRCV